MLAVKLSEDIILIDGPERPLLMKTNVSEYNKNHDKLGRFAKGGNGGSKELDQEGFESGVLQDMAGQTTWTREEIQEIENYMDFGFEGTNGKLRKAKGKVSDISDSYAPGTIKTIDGAMRNKLTGNTNLYRGIALDGKIDVGTTLTDHGFISTTFLKDKAVDFSDSGKGTQRYVLKIKAKKGTKGILGAAVNPSRLAREEAEYILPRGKSFTVTKKYTEVVGTGPFKQNIIILETEV